MFVEKEILIGNEQVTVTVNARGETKIVEFNGAQHEVRYVPLPDGRGICLVDGRVVEWSEMGGDSMHYVRSGGRLHHLKIVDPRALRRRASAGGLGLGTAEIKAPMPGKVVDVLVEKGQKVEANEGIVVLEAMKMENELRAPIDGIVSRLEAKVGSTVEPGRVIAVIEPGESS